LDANTARSDCSNAASAVSTTTLVPFASLFVRVIRIDTPETPLVLAALLDLYAGRRRRRRRLSAALRLLLLLLLRCLVGDRTAGDFLGRHHAASAIALVRGLHALAAVGDFAPAARRRPRIDHVGRAVGRHRLARRERNGVAPVVVDVRAAG